MTLSEDSHTDVLESVRARYAEGARAQVPELCCPVQYDDQYLKAYAWDGKKLSPTFTIDFREEKLGRPHQMRFGAYQLYGLRDDDPEDGSPRSGAVATLY